jgi:hypothetical protein
MKEDAKPVVFGLLAWLCFALAVGVSGWFRNASAPGVAATVWTLTALTLLACWRIQIVRDWIAIVDLRWLIALHLTRFVGIYFLILGNRGDLPEDFAKPAGIGDITIAVGAVALLLALGRDGATPSAAIPAWSAAARRLYRMWLLGAWNIWGLIDIIFVAFSALRFGLKDWQAMAPLRQLPLSLLPTFIVPLIIVSHILIFVRLKVDAASSRVVK